MTWFKQEMISNIGSVRENKRIGVIIMSHSKWKTPEHPTHRQQNRLTISQGFATKRIKLDGVRDVYFAGLLFLKDTKKPLLNFDIKNGCEIVTMGIRAYSNKVQRLLDIYLKIRGASLGDFLTFPRANRFIDNRQVRTCATNYPSTHQLPDTFVLSREIVIWMAIGLERGCFYY